MAIHNVFGSGAPPGTPAYATDGTPSIEAGNLFYIRNGDGYSDPLYECIGGRHWFPSGQSGAPTQVTISLYAGPITASGVTTDNNMHNMTPVRSVTATLVQGGWTEVTWAPVAMPRTSFRCMITVKYPDVPTGYVFLSGSHPATGTVNSSTAPNLSWTDDQASGVGAPVFQSYYHLGTTNSVGAVASGDTAATGGYSADIIVRDSGTTTSAYMSSLRTLANAPALGWRQTGNSTPQTANLLGWWNGSSLQPLANFELDPPGGSTPVRITTTAATFSPSVILKAGSTATATWTCEETSASIDGVNPTFSFGSAATRHVNLWIHDGSNNNRMNHAVVFNVGFNHTQDPGFYYPGSALDKAAQGVTKIEYINSLTALTTFCAANNTGLTGTIDFSGMYRLQFIECFQDQLTSVDLTGLSALVRLCIEQNNTTSIDLNPVAATLRDLRNASNTSGHMSYATMTQDLAVLYHYCVRDQAIYPNHVPMSRMPNLEEYWAWNTGIVNMVIPTGMNRLRDIQVYNNSTMGTLDMSNLAAGRAIGNARITASGCGLTSITPGPGVGVMDFTNNALPQSQVDALLAYYAGGTLSGGSLLLTGGSNGVPSSTGATNKATLIGRGWTVTTNAAADTTAPSVPTGLASSSITSSGFTVTWTASTDNVAVTGYEVFLDGVSYATPSTNSQVVTGRAASTAYSVTVRARDAAGNWSAQSSALSVTTSSSGGPTTSNVFAATGAPNTSLVGTCTQYSDGNTGLTTACAFYYIGTGATCTGARVWIPAGSPTNVALVVKVYATNKASNPTAIWASPTQSVTLASGAYTAGAWNSVTWTTPISMADFSAASTANQIMWIGYQYNINYIHSPGVNDTAVQASDGSSLYLGANPIPGTSNARSYNAAGGAAGHVYYGVDIVATH